MAEGVGRPKGLLAYFHDIIENSNDKVCVGDKHVINSRGKRSEAKEEKTEDVVDVNRLGNMMLRGT